MAFSFHLNPPLNTNRLLQGLLIILVSGLAGVAFLKNFWVTAVLLSLAAAIVLILSSMGQSAALDAADEGCRSSAHDNGPEFHIPQNSMPECAIVALLPDGSISLENDIARQWFGVYKDLAKGPDALITALIDEDSEKCTSLITVSLHDLDRQFVVTLLSRAPFPRAQLVDITREVLLERTAACQEMLTIMSHELLNGLTPIVSLSESVQGLHQDRLFDEIQAPLQTIHSSASRLMSFVDAFHKMSKLPQPVLKHFEVGSLVRELLQLSLARWPKAPIMTSLDPSVANAFVRLDKHLMTLAVSNLLNNAVEAISAVDSRDLPQKAYRTGLETADWICLSVKILDNALIIEVSDSGAGVPPEQMRSIFAPFFTTRANGSGIGLPLAKQIIEAQGGSLRLLSTFPTTFRIEIQDVIVGPLSAQ